MSKEIKLKPCPFCGQEAVLLQVYDSDIFIVGCTEDNLCPGHVGKLAPWYFGKELARIKWNRRAGEEEEEKEDE